MQSNNETTWTRRRFLGAGIVAAGALAIPSVLVRAVEIGPSTTLRRELWAMGGWNFLEVTADTRDVATSAINSMVDTIREIDRLFSVFDTHSPLSRFNTESALSVAIDDPILLASVAESLRCAEELEGVFDPTVEPLMRRLGFRENPQTPIRVQVAEKRDWDYRMIECDLKNARIRRESKYLQLDSGGWAKGLAAECAAQTALAAGATTVQVSCGGDIFRAQRSGLSDWTCAIRDPLNSHGTFAARAHHFYPTVATSGNSETFRQSVTGQRIGHLMDPHTGMPAESALLSVSVFGHNGLSTDAVSSGLFVMGKVDALRWLAAHPQFGAVLIDLSWPASVDGITAVGAVELA